MTVFEKLFPLENGGKDMNKSAILGLIAGISATVSFTEAKMMENCKIMLVDERFHWVDEGGTVVTLEEQEQKLGIPAGLKLPTTQEEMDKFYEIYAKSSSSQLAYCTDFWLVQKKNALDLFFTCTSVTAISSWLQSVRQFVGLMKQNPNVVFKIKVLRSYFAIWAESIKELESSTDTRIVLVPIQELKAGLRSLLNEINREKKIVSVDL